MGILLALGLAGRDRQVAVRAVAGASVVVLAATLYFTFSRGGWLTLAAGILAAVAVDSRRLQLLVSVLVVGIPGLLAAAVASRSDALSTEDSPLSAAVDQGREVALFVALLAVVAGAAVVAQVAAERRFHPGRPVRLAFGGAVAAVAVVALLAALVRLGGPVDAVERAYDSFTAEPAQQSEDLRERLFVFNANYRIDIWEVSWEQFKDDPILGGGAGTFEQYWNQHRDIDHKVRDVHNLYFETLGELGVVGLALLLVILAVPLIAAFGARRHPLAAGALGAYVAYLIHAGVDWDWELPAVTVVALACAAALLVMGAEPDSELVPGLRFRIAAGAAAAVMAGAAFVGLVGSSALSASDHAAVATPADWEEAADEARKAEDWAPWSSEPWQRLGDAQFGEGDLAAARESYRKAIEKEPSDWLLWLRLAEASSGAQREAALRQAARLNPLEDEVRRAQESGGG
jgi:O-Antigen ligase/Tetratricopeptide repeat